MTFPEKLDKLLVERGWSQQDLASRIGISASGVSAMTRGERRPYMDQAFLIAKAFGVPIEFLADDSADEPASTNEPTMDESYILRAIRAVRMDYDEAIRRLWVAPHVTHPPIEVVTPRSPARKDSGLTGSG